MQMKLMQTNRDRWLIQLLVCGVAALAMAPILTIAVLAFSGTQAAQLSNSIISGRQLGGTLALLLPTGCGVAVVGTCSGWLTACCRFPGRRMLRLAQLLPLATPAYLLAATLTDLGSIHGWRIHGLGWGIATLTLATYPYVFLLSTDSFSRLGQQQLEACRTLGCGPWRSFFRVALPLTVPAIGAGMALSGMEVVNELGAVDLLGIPALSAGILQRWQGDGNPAGAARLAVITLLVVASLIALERWLRRRSRRWDLEGRGQVRLHWSLEGWRALAAQLICISPPLLSLGIPLAWMSQRWQGRLEEADQLLALGLHSVGLALVAAGLTVSAALLLAIAQRWLRRPLLQPLIFLASMGYAIPGAVLALGLLRLGAPIGITPLALLAFGYMDRFMAVGRGSLDAALERIPPAMEEAATSLGSGWWSMLQRIHIPLLKGPLRVGALLVFVDTVKELPLTFALRPLNFDTLSVRVFQYAGDERLDAALGPAAIILILGLVASGTLMKAMEDTEPWTQNE